LPDRIGWRGVGFAQHLLIHLIRARAVELVNTDGLAYTDDGVDRVGYDRSPESVDCIRRAEMLSAPHDAYRHQNSSRHGERPDTNCRAPRAQRHGEFDGAGHSRTEFGHITSLGKSDSQFTFAARFQVILRRPLAGFSRGRPDYRILVRVVRGRPVKHLGTDQAFLECVLRTIKVLLHDKLQQCLGAPAM